MLSSLIQGAGRAAKIAQEPAEYGLLAKFGANARRVPVGTRA